MRQIDVGSLAALLCQIAVDAGAAVMRIYQDYSPTAAQLADKLDASPLTIADLAAHQLIIDRLASLTPESPCGVSYTLQLYIKCFGVGVDMAVTV